MSLEEKILINMKQYLGSEEVTGKINNAIKKATDDVIRDLFTAYHSPIKEIIDKNLRTGLLKQMEEEDYSQSVMSLELLVRQVIKDASAENNNTLKRFKDWATFEPPKRIKTSEIFEKYLEFAGKYINTSELEVEVDDEPYYIGGEASMEITTGGSVKLSCENDADLTFEFDITDWSKTIWFRDGGKPSLRMVDEFEFWLRNLEAHKVPVETDEMHMSDEIEVEEEPEASF